MKMTTKKIDHMEKSGVHGLYLDRVYIGYVHEEWHATEICARFNAYQKIAEIKYQCVNDMNCTLESMGKEVCSLVVESKPAAKPQTTVGDLKPGKKCMVQQGRNGYCEKAEKLGHSASTKIPEGTCVIKWCVNNVIIFLRKSTPCKRVEGE